MNRRTTSIYLRYGSAVIAVLFATLLIRATPAERENNVGRQSEPA
jgi:hypothetical protein